MKNSIILSGRYGKVFLLNALKCGYGSLIDDSFSDLLLHDESLFLNRRMNQKIFQLFMLHDEFIVPDFDLPCQFNALMNVVNVEIIDVESFITYSDDEHILPKLDDEYAQYIKPTIVNWLTKNAASFYNYRDEKISIRKYYNSLYDGFYKLSDKYKDIDHIWELNAKRFHVFQKSKMAEPDMVPNDYRKFYLVNIMSLLAITINELIWNLETGMQKDSTIVGSDMLLSGEKKNTNLHSAYQILKVEHNKILPRLPSFDNFSEVVKFKETRRSDIKRLRNVLSELESVLRNDGRADAILKAERDVMAAHKELTENIPLEKVLRWTTYLSLPIGIAELALYGSFVGLSISGAGFLTQMSADINVRRNNWLNVIR